MGWISLADTIEQVQAGAEALAADAAFAKLLDDNASTAYLAGRASQSVIRKIP